MKVRIIGEADRDAFMHNRLGPFDLTRRWVRLCILWYVCGLATGLVVAAWFAKARGIW
jgi:hypothetical protein